MGIDGGIVVLFGVVVGHRRRLEQQQVELPRLERLVPAVVGGADEAAYLLRHLDLLGAHHRAHGGERRAERDVFVGPAEDTRRPLLAPRTLCGALLGRQRRHKFLDAPLGRRAAFFRFGGAGPARRFFELPPLGFGRSAAPADP